jgi:hypothetical protein
MPLRRDCAQERREGVFHSNAVRCPQDADKQALAAQAAECYKKDSLLPLQIAPCLRPCFLKKK